MHRCLLFDGRTAVVRAALGESLFTDAFEAGHTLVSEQAIAYALETVERKPTSF